MNVIVVEDDRTLAGLIEMVARSRGHAVRAFDGATGVVEAITLPCTILLDLTLVEGDAPALVRQIKDDPATAATRIVLLSGSANLARIASECGADGWLKKPFGLAELESALSAEC